MKHLLNISCVVILSVLPLLLSSCIGSSDSKVEYIPVKTDKSSNWGMIGPDGKLLFEDEFKNTPSVMMGGIFTVEEEGGYTVYTTDNKKPTIVGDLENLTDAGMMSEGLIPVAKKGKRIEYYDKHGKLKFTLEPYKGSEITSVSGYFTDGLALFTTDEGCVGAINTKGEVAVEPKYDFLTVFRGGMALAQPHKGNNDSKAANADETYFELIDKNGKTIANIKGYEVLSYNYSGVICAQKDDRLGFIDKKGEFKKMPEKVNSITQYNDKLFVFSTDDSDYGVMDMDGEIIVRAKYKEISIVDNKTFLAKSDKGKYYIVNDKDERVKELEDVKDIMPLKQLFENNYGLTSDFGIIGTEGAHEWKFYNANGEPIDNKDYYELNFSNINTIVESDYFDASAAAKKITSYLGVNGYEKVQLGKPAYEYLTNAAPASYSSTYYFEFFNYKGNKYNIKGSAFSDSPIAKGEAVYTTEYFLGYRFRSFDHYSYHWNKGAVVNTISVAVEIAVKDQFENIKDALIRELKSKSYNVDENEKQYAILCNNTNYIFLFLVSDSRICMNIYSPSQWDSDKTRRIQLAVNNYSQAMSGKNNSIDTDTLEAVDSIAVDWVVADTVM